MTAGRTEAPIPREVELKYLVRDEPALRAWLARGWGGALDGIPEADPRTIAVEDRYVDTVRGALERAGFGARLRRVGEGPWVITVKSASSQRPESRAGAGKRSSAALAQRMEVEGPADERLDPAAWPPSAASGLVEEVRGRGRLHTLFTISQRREQRTLALGEGPVEVTLDRVTVLRGGRSVGAFSILEVEAGSPGSAGALERLAELLEASGLVTPEPRSKEEMARDLVASDAAERSHRLPDVPRSPGISAEDPLAEAGRKVLRMHLARMLAHEAGTRTGDDPEDLHKMRVATRRLRAAWRVFEGAYRPRLVRRYVRELRSVARALGEVRDLDVQREALDGYLRPLSEAGRGALEPLRATWRRERDTARGELRRLLDSRAYQDFVEDYLEFTGTPRAGGLEAGARAPSLVRDTAGSRILAAYERVRAFETVMAWADVPTLHALRIEGKRLRYTLESFAEVLPATARSLIADVTAMQDHLGLMNDAHVAAALTRAWLDGQAHQLPAVSREAVGLYLDSREAETERLRRTFGPVWRRVTGRAFRRGLGLVVTQVG